MEDIRMIVNDLLYNGIKESYINYLKNGSRSSIKVNCLHGKIAEALLLMYPDSKIGFEKKIKTIQGTARPDIFIEPNIAFMVKFPIASAVKNFHNSGRMRIGESYELKKSGYIVNQIEIIRKSCPDVGGDQKIKCWKAYNEKSFSYSDSAYKDKDLIDNFYLGIIDIENDMERHIGITPGSTKDTAKRFMETLEQHINIANIDDIIKFELTNRYDDFYDTFKNLNI